MFTVSLHNNVDHLDSVSLCLYDMRSFSVIDGVSTDLLSGSHK